MTFERKILAGFFSALAALMALGALTWHLTRLTIEASRFVSHTHQVILSANEISELVYRSEAALRAHLITGRSSFLEQRDTVVNLLNQEVVNIAMLTTDNPRQQRRIAELRHELDLREERNRYFITLLEREGFEAVKKQFGTAMTGSDGPRQGLTRIIAVRGAIEEEERGLLQQRQTEEAERTAAARNGFIVLMLLLAVVLPMTFLRVRRDMRERALAEEKFQQAARYDRSNAAALALYNAETSRSEILRGTMDILARDHGFPSLLFYGYEELGGALRLDVTRGAPAGVLGQLKLGEGLVGEVAQSQRMIEIVDTAKALAELPVDTGFAMVAPAALLYCPISYRGTPLGVLAMASTAAITPRDRAFVERMCTQLGAALHNIKQLEDMRLLAEQLRARSEEISQQNRQVEEASRMKSEFLANMSHELRTPLNAIIGFSEVIKDGMAGPTTPEQAEYTSDILASGQHLLALINDILDLSKIEAGHMSLDLEPANVGTLVQSGLAIVAEKALNNQVTLTHSVADGLDWVCLDVRKTKQILYNLLSNAVKFTLPQGHVDLSVRRVRLNEIAACNTQPGLRVFPVIEADHDW
ncbi:MAG: histidine kinase dimerization/phospho-acceptor domain-containing protein, partial [Janthinobacterium lividum]